MSAGRAGRPGREEAGGSLVLQGFRGLRTEFRFSSKCSEKSSEVFEQRSDIDGFMFLKGHLGSCEESGWRV